MIVEAIALKRLFATSVLENKHRYNMQFLVETEIACPHCGETFPLQIDTSQPEQSLIEDCTVCCRPIHLTIRCQPGAVVNLDCS